MCPPTSWTATCPPPAVGHVGELLRRRQLLERHRDDLVFLLRPGATHLELLVIASLHGREVGFGILVRALGIDPQDELVERQHGDRRQVLPVERHARRKRRREQVRERDDDLVRIVLGALHLDEGFRAGTTALVHDDQWLLHQIVLGNDALDEARHLVGATAGACRNEERHGLGRLPGRLSHDRRAHSQCETQSCGTEHPSLGIVVFLPGRPPAFHAPATVITSVASDSLFAVTMPRQKIGKPIVVPLQSLDCAGCLGQDDIDARRSKSAAQIGIDLRNAEMPPGSSRRIVPAGVVAATGA